MKQDVAAAILNVSPDAEAEIIRAAFKLRSRMWHPDRFVGRTDRERSEAATEFIRVAKAFEVLSPRLRQQHDIENPPTAATDSSSPNVKNARGRGTFSVREYLGFGTSSVSIWEYLGFGSSQE